MATIHDGRHEIELGMRDAGLAELLQCDRTAYVEYGGDNFCAYVGAAPDGGPSFMCEIWQHGSPVETIYCKTLEEVMEQVSSKYGDE